MKILLIEDEFEETSPGYAKSVHLIQSTKYPPEILSSGQFDAILIVSGGRDSLEVCSRLSEKNTDKPVIVLTENQDTEESNKYYQSGVDYCIPYLTELKELWVKIKALTQRKATGKISNQKKICIEDLDINLESRTVKRNNQKIGLSVREFNLLVYLIKHRGKFISSKVLAEKIWGNAKSLNSVYVYINQLRKKIDKPYTRKYILTHPGLGYKFE
jgi:DNA-binding response OmpR family regulator